MKKSQIRQTMEISEDQVQTSLKPKYNNAKNIVLFSLAVLSQLHVMFRDSGVSVIWYSNDLKKSLNLTVFLTFMIFKDIILTYCLYKPKGIDKRVPLFLLILSIIDILHLAVYSFHGLEEVKIALTFVIFIIIKKYYKC